MHLGCNVVVHVQVFKLATERVLLLSAILLLYDVLSDS